MSRPGRAWLVVEENLEIRSYDDTRDMPEMAFVVTDSERADHNAARRAGACGALHAGAGDDGCLRILGHAGVHIACCAGPRPEPFVYWFGNCPEERYGGVPA
jgi:hypothetical protein